MTITLAWWFQINWKEVKTFKRKLELYNL